MMVECRSEAEREWMTVECRSEAERVDDGITVLAVAEGENIDQARAKYGRETCNMI